MLTLDGSEAGAATFNNKIVATELDISGDVDVDGTLEADAITIGSTAIGSIYGVVAGSSSIVTTGAINSGSITSGFGTIDTGSSAITTTGLISGGSLDIDNVLINGTTIGHTDDTDLITVADSLLTIDGDVTITGGTPTLTIGDAGTEDAKIVFDGNAQDFHIGLDDTDDDLVIGLGSTLGTTPAISIAETLKTTFGGGAIGATYAVAATGNITMNFDLYTNFQITADSGNVTLLNGTGTLTEGQSGVIVLIQDGTGSRTLSTGTDYEWPAGTAGTISTAANAVDIIPYYIDDNDSILLGAPQLAFSTP
jgi:cytoskeletal protein CcmA (bactofilin family)